MTYPSFLIFLLSLLHHIPPSFAQLQVQANKKKEADAKLLAAMNAGVNAADTAENLLGHVLPVDEDVLF